ncbi:MAG: hemolysin family protein [Ilumatobacteraceae bacterium]|nr:hemolysin family protein [Ilumatobacteraceae bacterium]
MTGPACRGYRGTEHNCALALPWTLVTLLSTRGTMSRTATEVRPSETPSPAPSAAVELLAKPLLRGWFHVASFVIVGVIGLFLLAFTSAPPADRVTIVIYLLGTLSMFGVSALYHRGRWTVWQTSVWKRLDHSTIFLAIAGAYTPVAVAALHGWHLDLTLATAWIGAIIGISLQWVPIRLPRWLFSAMYVIVGWSISPSIGQAIHGLGWVGFSMLMAGGVAYTGGAVVYALKRPDPWPRVFGYHEVFHGLTVIGAGLHLATIAFVAAPKL